MYRGPDPMAALHEAYRACGERWRELQAARAAALRANVRLIQSGHEIIEVPEYQRLGDPPAGALDPTSAAAVAQRYADLARYYGAEAARLAEAAESAAARVESLFAPRPLASPPRAVPFSYVVAEALRGYWVVLRWVLFPPITMVCGAAAFGAATVLHPLVALVPLPVLALYALARMVTRVRLLADAECPEILSRTSARGMGSSKNWPRQIARGWNVSVEPYTGPSYRTTLAFRTSRGAVGSAVAGGPRYEGFLLALPDAGLALPLTEFGSVPRPDALGRWDPSLPSRVWVTSVIASLLVLVWLGYGAYGVYTLIAPS